MPSSHHRHAEWAADGQHVRAGLKNFARALLIDALIGRLLHKAHAAPAATAETLGAASFHLDHILARGDLHELPRRVINAVLSS